MKHITGFYYLSYRERLERFQQLSLKLRRDALAVCFIQKILQKMLSITPESVGILLCRNNTRSEGVKLFVPRPNFSLFKTSFMYRATCL